jgi:hypothetical protein
MLHVVLFPLRELSLFLSGYYEIYKVEWHTNIFKTPLEKYDMTLERMIQAHNYFIWFFLLFSNE